MSMAIQAAHACTGSVSLLPSKHGRRGWPCSVTYDAATHPVCHRGLPGCPRMAGSDIRCVSYIYALCSIFLTVLSHTAGFLEGQTASGVFK